MLMVCTTPLCMANVRIMPKIAMMRAAGCELAPLISAQRHTLEAALHYLHFALVDGMLSGRLPDNWNGGLSRFLVTCADVLGISKKASCIAVCHDTDPIC